MTAFSIAQSDKQRQAIAYLEARVHRVGCMAENRGQLGLFVSRTGWDSAMNILNNWKMLDLVTRDGEPLVCIEGRGYGSNPRFPTSSHIRTSPVTDYSLNSNSMVIMTKRGSEYLLGKPDPSQAFAQQRLMRRLSRLTQTSAPSFNELESQLTGFEESNPSNAHETAKEG